MIFKLITSSTLFKNHEKIKNFEQHWEFGAAERSHGGARLRPRGLAAVRWALCSFGLSTTFNYFGLIFALFFQQS